MSAFAIASEHTNQAHVSISGGYRRSASESVTGSPARIGERTQGGSKAARVESDGIQSLCKPHQLAAQVGQPLAEIARAGLLKGSTSLLERRDDLGP